MTRVLVLLIPLLIATGCNASQERQYSARVAHEMSVSPPPMLHAPAPVEYATRATVGAVDASSGPNIVPAGMPLDLPSLPPSAPRMLVQNAELTVRVAGTESAADSAQRMAARLGGFTSSVQTERVEGVMRYQLTLRVPGPSLLTMLSGLKRLGTAESESRTAEDVTDQAVDLDARLRALRVTENELLALLSESRARSRQVDEIMSVYRELTGVRSQIETLVARRAQLGDRVALSTIRLRILPVESAVPVAAHGGWNPLDVARGATRGLLLLLATFGTLAIYGVIIGIPVALMVAALIWAGRQVGSRLRIAGMVGTAVDRIDRGHTSE